MPNLPILLGLFLSTMAVAASHAQGRLDNVTTRQLVDILAQPMADAPESTRSLTRSLRRPAARLPDPETNLCETLGSTLQRSEGGGKTRGLYVTEAPKVDLNVRFAFDSSRIMPDAEPILDALGAALKDPVLRAQSFILAGHTDRRGDDNYNKRLSCERAIAVRDYLAKKHGISQNRLVTMGFGFGRLLDSDQPEAEENRRVEVRRH